MTARTPGYAAIQRGERWCVRWCPGCQKRRMMPESEERCLGCQETGGRRQPRVLHLPNLRTVREQARMTREELEECVGISRFRLHLIEEGQRRVKVRTARKIAAALGTTVEGLSTTAPVAVVSETRAGRLASLNDERGAA